MSSGTASQNNSDKEWRGLKLTPLVTNKDGTNNYSEFARKSELDLDAAGYWQYVDGPNYKPPVIPNLVPSFTFTGHDEHGVLRTITAPGNEAIVDQAKKGAEGWFAQDKKVLTIIVRAVGIDRLYV